MGRIKEQDNLFNDNYNGVLNHDGSILVAKTTVKQKILNISKRSVLVQGRRNSYPAEIHKDMYSFMDFVEEGDMAYIKFRNGKAWFVGFQKNKSVKNNVSIDTSESLTNFMEGVDVE